MKIWSTEHIFNHPWETVTKAVWRKYPNPHKPEIVGADVIDRHVEDNILHTKRIISSKWGLPDWAKRVIGGDRIAYAFEHSEVNPIEQRMVMRTQNLTLASTVSMTERLEYSPDPNDASKTLLRQETLITVHGVPLTSYIENYLLRSITRSSFNGREAMELVINKINKEVEDIMQSCKRGTSDLKTSLGKIQGSANKSITDISVVLNKAEEL